MKVVKAINNNVVSCLDDRGQELVVMGKGLGFHAKPGEILRSEGIEKVFRMDSPEEFSRMKELFAQLPPDLLELCSRIIDYANLVLGKRLNQSVYLTLTDHIQFAIERCRHGLQLPNALSTEVRVFYPEEYAIGTQARELILAEQHIDLPEDEAASIALHIVNAEYGSTMNVTMRAAHVLPPITAILESWPNLRLDKDSLSYSELMVHLKFMAMQAFSPDAPLWTDDTLADVLEPAIPDAFQCARAICAYLAQQCENPISASEQACLALCIRRACR